MKMTLKKTIYCALFALITGHSAPAQGLLITEINSNASLGDFWELTNFGTTPVNLFNGSTPWKWNDDSLGDAGVILPLGLSIAPGESMVFQADNPDATSFRTAWALPTAVQVIPDTTGTGLGMNDAVTLFDDAGLAVVSLDYGVGTFTRSNGSPSLAGHAGVSAGGSSATQSAIFDPTFGNTPATARYTFADGTNFGSYDAPGSTGFGSPGQIPEPSSAILLSLGSLFAAARRRRPAPQA